MTPVSRPPLLAERLLSAIVPGSDWRESITGDLREEFIDVSRRHGSRAARRWYWRQALAIGGHAFAARVGAPRSPRGSWLTRAELDDRASWRVGFVRDLAYAWRSILRRPGMSSVVVLTLALTLATNSGIFALVDGLVLRPYRFAGVDRVVLIASSGPQDPLLDRESVAAADFRDWRNEMRTVTHLSASEWWDANLSGIETPEQVAGFRVTANFFKALGVTPMLGRDFAADEERPGQHRRVVIGHRLWTRVYGADPDIVGQTVRLDSEPYDVIGVAPERFAIPDGAEVWAPLAYTPEEWSNRRGTYLTVIGRLADDASLEQARAEVTSIVVRLRREHPDTNGSRPVTLVDFTTGMADPGAGPFLGIVQAAGILLLLIACANIANLLLARGSERAQEFALRLALGAGRGRLAWQTLLEGGLLALIALAFAVPLTVAAIGLSRSTIPPSVIRFIPGFEFIRLNVALFLAMAAACAVATLLFSIVPAWQATRTGVSETIRQGGRTMTGSRRRHWMGNTLATAQVALTLALLFGSALMLTGVGRAVDGSFGFDKRNVLVARLTLPERAYADPERRRAFAISVLDRMRTIPAVTNVAAISTLPYGGGNTRREFWPEGVSLRQPDVRSVDFRRATPEYFATMRIPLLAGRGFSADDRQDTQSVAVVSRSLAHRYWAGQDPVGRRFKLSADGEWIGVVGVVGDVLHDWFQQRRAPTVYRPLSQDAPYSHAFVARTIGDPQSVAGDLRRAVAAADADQPIVELRSMESRIADRTAGLTSIAQTFTVVALIAFVLAIGGLYSLMSYVASRRTQEIGVRMALGAGWWQVIRLTTGQAVRILVVGSLAGAVLAAALGRVMESVLVGSVSIDFWQLGGLIALLAVVALTAAYLPARRAAAVDPTVALRSE